MKSESKIDEPVPEDELLDLLSEHIIAPAKRPKKLKYQDKGFRIEISRKDGEWKLLKYYRNEVDMRAAYNGLNEALRRAACDPKLNYRMVFGH